MPGSTARQCPCDLKDTGAQCQVASQVCLRALGFHVKKADVLSLMDQFDKDKTNGLAFDEFEQILTEKYLNRPFSELVDRAFQAFDIDEQGRISQRTLKKVVKEVGENISDDELHDMIAMFDKNGDGFIDKDEFKAVLKDYDPDRVSDDDED
jgi:centrin-3